MEETRPHYGLFTTVTMIIGICIGSGIFFKSDNILAATGGSVPLGVLVFVLGATSIIFGGLSISELASRTDRPGGIITYVEEFASEKLACGMGWFQIFVYFPTIAAVVSWVVGIYICLLFGWDGTLENQMLIGFLFYTLTFLMNALSARLGGGFQNFSTISKMIPLAIIAVCGLIFGNPAKGFQSISPNVWGGVAVGDWADCLFFRRLVHFNFHCAGDSRFQEKSAEGAGDCADYYPYHLCRIFCWRFQSA